MNLEEEFLLSQIESFRQVDKEISRCWLIFSKSIFPQSFPILFESYKMECEGKNVNDSALCLSSLVSLFPSEPLLIKELIDIADALHPKGNDFAKAVFELLPEDIKYEVMLAVTLNAQTVEKHCTLMLLFLSKLPDARLIQHGKDIIETLLKAESNLKVKKPVNLFRKILVVDALPLLLKVSLCGHKLKAQIFSLLQKAIEFYVCCMFSSPADTDAAVLKNLLSSSDSNSDEGWKLCLELIETVFLFYKWSSPEICLANFKQLNLQQLIVLLKQKNKTLSGSVHKRRRHEETTGFEEAYFCLVVSFFYYLHQFGKLIHPEVSTMPLTEPFKYILMEGIVFPDEDCTEDVPRKCRTEKGFVIVSKCAPTCVADMLRTSFVTAVDCWALLHRHQLLLKEFTILCSNIKLDTWPVFNEFYIGMLLYEGIPRNALELLEKNHMKDVAYRNKTALQIASCYYSLMEHEAALNTLFGIIATLSPNSSHPIKATTKCSSRNVYFMGNKSSEIVQYCVSMLLKLYKVAGRIDNPYKDMALGYVLVLIQYDLENEYATLATCVETIKTANSFCFPQFFKYIIHPIILEEIAFLTTKAGGSINLEILSPTSSPVSKQRAITRGINKGAKEDLKQAFINQMARCYENLENLLMKFITEEHNFLLLPLIHNRLFRK